MYVICTNIESDIERKQYVTFMFIFDSKLDKISKIKDK